MKNCNIYQTGKVTGINNYGKIHLPTDKIVDPWDTVHVDLLGVWKFKFYNKESKRIVKEINAFSAIDDIWPEATSISNKKS